MREPTLQQVNCLDDDSFVDTSGEIYEYPPWVAGWARSPQPSSSVDGLRSAMKRVVEDTSREKQLQPLRAHLGPGKRTETTDASEVEQASAELDSPSWSQYGTFQRLNETYRERFGFPFATAVKDENPGVIAAAMERQADHSESTEFRTALDEVHTIAEFRLAKRFSPE